MAHEIFWQHLLKIDPEGKRLPDLIKGLEASSLFDPSASLLSHPALSPADRRRIAASSLRGLESAIAGGARAVSTLSLGWDWESMAAPPGLFVRGDLDVLDSPRAAIVGTRSCSTYGKAAAAKFAEHLARAGVVVVSGGALGIDAAAHRAALEAGGRSIAVLPVGIDKAYPAAHAPLFDQIVEQGGLLVSQFPVGGESFPINFILRNHTIACISDAVIVVEAPEASGALRTARAGAELGREVFVVPGPITHQSFRGSHALIRDGAVLVDHPDQVLEALGVSPAAAPSAADSLEPEGRAILDCLSDGPLSIEAMTQKLGRDAEVLMAELSILELEGLVFKAPEGYAAKT